MNYKYNEGELIEQLKEYVDSTYDQHYSKNKFQATEFIIDGGHGEGFALGNILKYTQRYGHKNGKNRKDLMKVLHYALIALYVHDLQETKIEPKGDTVTLTNSGTITPTIVLDNGAEINNITLGIDQSVPEVHWKQMSDA
jgi:hypothetical protein